MVKQRVVFVHGEGSFGAAAWPRQHGMALTYDALFLRRHGYDPVAEPVESSFAADTSVILAALADDGRGTAGGHVVAHSQGAVGGHDGRRRTPGPGPLAHAGGAGLPVADGGLPATAAHIRLMQPLFDARHQLSDEDFQRGFVRRVYADGPAGAHLAGGEAVRPAAAAAGCPRGKRRCTLFRACPPWC